MFNNNTNNGPNNFNNDNGPPAPSYINQYVPYYIPMYQYSPGQPGGPFPQPQMPYPMMGYPYGMGMYPPIQPQRLPTPFNYSKPSNTQNKTEDCKRNLLSPTKRHGSGARIGFEIW